MKVLSLHCLQIVELPGKLLSCACHKPGNDKLTLVQVMVWCYQATSHYLCQSLPKFMWPYNITWPQGVKLWCPLCMLQCWWEGRLHIHMSHVQRSRHQSDIAAAGAGHGATDADGVPWVQGRRWVWWGPVYWWFIDMFDLMNASFCSPPHGDDVQNFAHCRTAQI